MDDRPATCPKKGGRYINPHSERGGLSLWEALLWWMGKFRSQDPLPPMPADFKYPAHPHLFERNKPYAAWIGHSTYIVDCGGFTFLTDPVWDAHCSPVPLAALKRQTQVPFPLEALPPLNAIFISHNHYDHLDEKTVLTLAALFPSVAWILPIGLSKWFKRRGIGRCNELNWWDSISIQGHRITAVPTQHFSGRTLWDRNKTLWNGYIAENLATGKKVYFVGDTGYNSSDFKQIGNRFSPIDLSLIPIGTYVPRELMSSVHTSPFDAVAIHSDVGSRLSLGMHWKTFRLSDEPLERPPYDLYRAMKEKNLPYATFLPIDIGTYVNW